MPVKPTISSPAAFDRVTGAAAYRASPAFTASPEAVTAWLRWGETQAATIKAPPFDAQRFREVLDEVRSIGASNPALHLEFTPHGGHVGFVGGRVPWKPFYYAEQRACEFLASRAGVFQPNPLPSVP